ncbi:MAG: hypothetical protein ACTSW1_06535 [Candidatus Hodarchaeales archaeon]
MSFEELLFEMKKNNLLLTISNIDKITAYLESIATTEDRKKIWILIDGKLTTQEIADIIDVSARSVTRFIKLADDAGLVINNWGQPAKKIIEIVPNSWLELIEDDEE